MAMPVIERYWEGVLRRLQAEVDLLAGVVNHHGERGRENELALMRVLENLVPRRYGLGSGILIDSEDGYGSQTDIVIFDQGNEPSVFAQTTQLLFPVENVRACVEVKSMLTKDEIRDVGKKKRALSGLRGTEPGTAPMFVLFAYRASSHPLTVAKNLRELPDEERPDLTCVISPGLVGPVGDCCLALTPLHSLDAHGGRMSGVFRQPKADEADYGWVDGASYPRLDLKSNPFLGEPARALLLFCSRLLSALARRDDQRGSVVPRYLSPEAKQVVCMDCDPGSTCEWLC